MATATGAWVVYRSRAKTRPERVVLRRDPHDGGKDRPGQRRSAGRYIHVSSVGDGGAHPYRRGHLRDEIRDALRRGGADAPADASKRRAFGWRG
jgi:hypothetical protein